MFVHYLVTTFCDIEYLTVLKKWASDIIRVKVQARIRYRRLLKKKMTNCVSHSESMSIFLSSTELIGISVFILILLFFYLREV